jgi:hypothetical protein
MECSFPINDFSVEINIIGFCANYTEIRRFLTSAANHEISKSQSGLFIPNGICLKISGGGFIQEGSDNKLHIQR